MLKDMRAFAVTRCRDLGLSAEDAVGKAEDYFAVTLTTRQRRNLIGIVVNDLTGPPYEPRTG